MSAATTARGVLVRKVAKIDDMEPWALRCHAWGHPWNRPTSREFSYYGFRAILVMLDCPTCSTVRRDVRRHSNPRHLITRAYRYPHDYLAAFPVTVPDYRDEWFRRFPAPPDDVLENDEWRTWSAAA